MLIQMTDRVQQFLAANLYFEYTNSHAHMVSKQPYNIINTAVRVVIRSVKHCLNLNYSILLHYT